jgi:hypothetical protein
MMAASYRIADPIIVVVLEGVVTDAEVVKAQDEMFSDPDFIGNYPRLIDASGVTKLQLSQEVVRQHGAHGVPARPAQGCVDCEHRLRLRHDANVRRRTHTKRIAKCSEIT